MLSKLTLNSEGNERKALTMKIGIFGGTFDPPHMSHVLACLYVLETTDIDKIFVIPCSKHPFSKDTVDFTHRFEMCRLAMKPLEDGVEVLDIEGKRGGVSYTIDTVKELKEKYPADDFVLIIGSDILDETHEWKDIDELERIVEIHVLPRLMEDSYEKVKESDFFFLPDISSTEIRERIASRKPIDHLVAQSVLRYIQLNSLYNKK